MTTTSSAQDYAQQIARITQALAVARNDVVSGDLFPADRLELVEMFTDGNLEKRFDKLADQLELLEEAFADLPDLINEYIESIPLAAYDSGSSDGDRFACWLVQRQELTSEQRDLVTVIRSRYALEEVGRRHRLEHIRFQELCSVADQLADELPTNTDLRLHLNPIRLWACFKSDLFSETNQEDESEKHESEEDEVLFFAVGSDIRTVAFDASGRSLLKTLGEIGPCLLDELELRLQLTSSDFHREQIVDVLNECGQLGLVAFS